MNSAADIWTKVLSLLEKDLPPVAIQTWFDDAVAVELNGNSFVIYTPTQFKYDIITSRYQELIEKHLFEIFGTETVLVILREGELEAHRAQNPENKNLLFGSMEYTFDSFVVGSSNRFAYNAAMAVANKPGNTYNPLFIYGPSGLGKTHLLYAIANRIQKTKPDLRICYVKGDQFTNELVQSIGHGTNAEFREKYRECDLLLMDDVQFIAGKDQTQIEFFHTFNTLYEAKKQIVLTADHAPNELNRLEERLCTRFQQGLLADIQPPDYETRMAIIKNKAMSMGLDLPESVAEYIAENITSNVRQLEGTVRKILAYQELMGSNLDIDTVIRAIRDLIRERNEFVPSPDEIIEETAKFYGLNPQEIKGLSRTKEINTARQISMYLIRHITTLSLKEIGRVFNRDHSTVMHAIEKVERLVKENRDTAEIIKDIKANLDAKNC
ncbi:MAG: chromosomal replication initiator protein DnaA [Oscillospiraceae bacterium]|nr:chromosomal replication initiator protein DnaA [Oscillospiraceae bacterium]